MTHTLTRSRLSDLISDRVHEHQHGLNCDDEDGGKPSTDCERCVLEHVARDMEIMQEQLDRYREARAISVLEAMPSGAAIERAAAFLHEWDSAEHHFAAEPFAESPKSEQEAWRLVAAKLLRAAAGLPPEAR